MSVLTTVPLVHAQARAVALVESAAENEPVLSVGTSADPVERQVSERLRIWDILPPGRDMSGDMLPEVKTVVDCGVDG